MATGEVTGNGPEVVATANTHTLLEQIHSRCVLLFFLKKKLERALQQHNTCQSKTQGAPSTSC